MKPRPGFEETLKALQVGEGWTWDKGSWWLADVPALRLREIAKTMLANGARFVAITAAELPSKEIRLDYQWDLQGQLLTFISATVEQQAPTIVDLSPAVDWVERETHEYFAVEFTGRESTKPLMTRPGDPIGINLHKEQKEEVAQ